MAATARRNGEYCSRGTIPCLRRLVPFLALPLALCAGCLTYLGITFDSEKPLAEPTEIPVGPDLSTDFAAYRNFAIATDPSSFSESILATDMGRGGLVQTVGKVPLRTIAARGIRSLVEKHFRAPLPDERPAALLETTPQFLSVKQDGRVARVKLSVAVRCVKQDEDRTVLLKNTYKGERTGPWVEGQVPVALYEALDDVWSAFLKDFRANVRPATLMDGTESSIKMPELQGLSFGTKRGDDASVAVGSCTVACNGWEAFQAAAWAKQQIFSQCVEHLGVEKERVRVRYDNDATKFDEVAKSWKFVFSTWARTRMVMQYDANTRRGRAIVDLGLFGGTAEEAAKAAKEYAMREMNLRAATYADDAPEAKADVDFLGMETDAESNLVIVNFKLVY